ncbi:MAG TPA: helix-turn-helix domain-containing protein [Lachnospiraceae bacterium]|nr:helix-turn-helix domain-containing protein [Lachnospiraceae bacterium]
MEKEVDYFQLFGSRLAESRREQHLTQEEMASRLGITPQALSKWERGISSPDLSMLTSICGVLGVSSDYLLGIGTQKITEDGNEKVQGEIWSHLREGLEPLELFFGEEIVPAFQNENYLEKVVSLRMQLSREGILMPIIHIQDMTCVESKEFMVLAYQNVIYSEKLETIDENTMDYIFGKLSQTIHNKYAEIINIDIMKRLVDNLKIKYPALIEGIVPERISYGLLTEIAKQFMNRGNSLIYLPKIIEVLEMKLRENQDVSVLQLSNCVNTAIEREDNIRSVLAKRNIT